MSIIVNSIIAIDAGLDLLTPEWSEILYDALIQDIYCFIGDKLFNKSSDQSGISNLFYSTSTNEKEDQKAVLGRYRSDTNLDR